MRTAPVSPALGVELLDFDITRPCSSDEQAELRQLLCDHGLILVRSTTMTDADHDRFIEYFGPIFAMGSGTEKSVILENDAPGTKTPFSAALAWHFDLAFIACPNIATSLWAQDVAPGATATGFLNAVRALETLPAELRDRIEGLNARHIGKLPDANGNAVPIRGEGIDPEAEAAHFPTHIHPIAFKPPHHDNRSLFVAPQMTSQIVGLPKDEGDSLLDTLLDHMDSPEHIYLHDWQVGDVIIWDNMALQHARPAEMGSVTRKLRRLATAGWHTGEGTMDWRVPFALSKEDAEQVAALADR